MRDAGLEVVEEAGRRRSGSPSPTASARPTGSPTRPSEDHPRTGHQRDHGPVSAFASARRSRRNRRPRAVRVSRALRAERPGQAVQVDTLAVTLRAWSERQALHRRRQPLAMVLRNGRRERHLGQRRPFSSTGSPRKLPSGSRPCRSAADPSSWPSSRPPAAAGESRWPCCRRHPRRTQPHDRQACRTLQQLAAARCLDGMTPNECPRKPANQRGPAVSYAVSRYRGLRRPEGPDTLRTEGIPAVSGPDCRCRDPRCSRVRRGRP